MRDDVAAAYGGLLEPIEAPVDGAVDLGPDLNVIGVEGGTTTRATLGVFFWICVGWLGILAFLTIFANLLPFDDPGTSYFGVGADKMPSWSHLLGTDELDRDILARLVFGARTSLFIGILATAIGISLGGALGMLSAYIRGRFDATLSFIMYCILAFPAIIAVIAILDFWGRSQWHIIIVLGTFGIPLIFRLTRAATLATVTKEYVTAARSQGATSARVLARDVFPNVSPALIVYAVFTLGGVIAVEGALAYLGLSVQPPAPTWGNLISEVSGDLSATIVYILSPALALFFTLVSLYTIGEKIRQRFDPGELKL